jgi:hypothetical protein
MVRPAHARGLQFAFALVMGDRGREQAERLPACPSVWRRMLSRDALVGWRLDESGTVTLRNRNWASVHGQLHAGIDRRRADEAVAVHESSSARDGQMCAPAVLFEQAVTESLKPEFAAGVRTCQGLPTDLGHMFKIAMRP